jgi:hypothetical protein
VDYYVTSAVTHKIVGGPFPDYETAEREAERQRKQSIGGYGRFNIVTAATAVSKSEGS